jgi:hypothetical protein
VSSTFEIVCTLIHCVIILMTISTAISCTFPWINGKVNEWKWKFESNKMSVPAPSPTRNMLYHIIQIMGDQVRSCAHEDNKMDMTDCFPSLW